MLLLTPNTNHRPSLHGGSASFRLKKAEPGPDNQVFPASLSSFGRLIVKQKSRRSLVDSDCGSSCRKLSVKKGWALDEGVATPRKAAGRKAPLKSPPKFSKQSPKEISESETTPRRCLSRKGSLKVLRKSLSKSKMLTPTDLTESTENETPRRRSIARALSMKSMHRSFSGSLSDLGAFFGSLGTPDFGDNDSDDDDTVNREQERDEQIMARDKASTQTEIKRMEEKMSFLAIAMKRHAEVAIARSQSFSGSAYNGAVVISLRSLKRNQLEHQALRIAMRELIHLVSRVSANPLPGFQTELDEIVERASQKVCMKDVTEQDLLRELRSGEISTLLESL